MQIKIIEKHFGGVEFTPEMRVLHLGGQSSANVERLEFQLPESWQGKSVTLHIQRQDGCHHRFCWTKTTAVRWARSLQLRPAGNGCCWRWERTDSGH